MTIQHFYKNTIRQRKNSKWLQWSGNSDKPENDTKIKILKFQENYHKPSLPQGLVRFYKVTPCNEKCNFFILLQNIPLLRILLFGIIPLCRDETSLFSSVGGECAYGIHTRRMPYAHSALIWGMLNSIHTVDSLIP